MKVRDNHMRNNCQYLFCPVKVNGPNPSLQTGLKIRVPSHFDTKAYYRRFINQYTAVFTLNHKLPS